MDQSMFRWGILGAATIARKNWKAIRNTGNGIVVAVASRDVERSRRFVNECQAEAPFSTAPRALGSYEEMVGAEDIDGVYVPAPTAIRKEWVMRAAKAGKHVVCEKPCAISVPDLREMLKACEDNNVQFMDGVMFMHSRRFERVRQAVHDGKTVGPIRRISSVFSVKGSPEFFATNIRVRSELEPLGCLGDLGWYCIRFALSVMEGRLPLQVSGRLLAESEHEPGQRPVPTEFSGELFFEGGTSSSFYCSFIAELQQWANVSGTLGSLSIPDFVLPFFGHECAFETQKTLIHIQGCDFNMEPSTRHWPVAEYGNSHPSAQETNLFRHFAHQAKSGMVNRAWPEIALKTQQVMERCLESARSGGRIVEAGS